MTEIARNMPTAQKGLLYLFYPIIKLVSKDAVHGAQTSLFCAASTGLDGVGGIFII